MAAAIAIGDLFAAGEVVFIMEIVALLEYATTNRAKKGLKNLISLAPTKGRRITDGKEEMIPAEEIRQGDILRILPGETIPIDGKIISGETSVDQSIMTGESLPVDKGIGEDIFCGTINRFGSIDISATKVGENSSLQKLIRMVQEAENKQALMQRIADRIASWLVPAALLIAILSYVFTRNIITAVTMLVVFCPCALVLATPTAIMAAIGQATKYGVIIKSGDALEKMGKMDTIAFDKTGTLTYGRLDVSDIISFDETVNDAPALKTADVSVAMGSMGSDIAIDAADIALMSDDISKIPYLKRLSNATVKTIKFSISLSTCINFTAILLSLMEVLTPTAGALVHNAGSCLVVLIAALLYDRKFE